MLNVHNNDLEKAAISLVNRLSPADVIQSKSALEICFREFFARGTVDESLKLLPQLHKNAILGLSVPQSISGNSTVVREDMLSCRSSSRSTPPTSTSLPAEDTLFSNAAVVQYFKAKGVHEKRAKKLTRLVKSFTNAKVLSNESYESLWSDKTEIFNHRGGTRIARLREGRQKIESIKTENESAARLALMYSVHEVNEFLLSSTQAEGPLVSGRGKKTYTLEAFARINNIAKEEIHNDRHNSKAFFQLLAKAGPGSLFELESNTASYWGKATEDDVDLLLEFREFYLPATHKRAEESDQIAARTIIKGLQLYGWSSAEIESSTTPFLTQVRIHLEGNGCPCEGRTGSVCRDCSDTTDTTAENTTGHSKKRRADDHLDSNRQIPPKNANNLLGTSTHSREAIPTNGNLQDVNSHLVSAEVLNCRANIELNGGEMAQHLRPQAINSASSENSETLNASNNLVDNHMIIDYDNGHNFRAFQYGTDYENAHNLRAFQFQCGTDYENAHNFRAFQCGTDYENAHNLRAFQCGTDYENAHNLRDYQFEIDYDNAHNFIAFQFEFNNACMARANNSAYDWQVSPATDFF